MWLVPMKGLLLLVSLHTAMSSNTTYTMASTTPAEFLNLTSTFLLSPSTSLPPDLTTTLVVAPNISSTSTPSPASTSAPNNATSTPSPASTSAPNNATSTPNPATNTPSPASTNTPNISSSSTLSSTYSVTSSFITSPSVSTPVVASSSVTGVSSGSLTMSSPALQTQNTSTAMRTSLTSTPAASQLGDVPITISGAISTPTPPATTTTTTTTTSQTIIIIAAAAGGGGLVLVLVLVICCVCCYCCLCRRQYEYATGNNPGYHVTVQQWKEDQAHYTANRSGSMSSQASSNRGSFGVRLGRGSRGSKKSVRSRDAGDYTVENPGVFSTPL